ncbi:DNA-binding FrmR family transcriptional regulator [Fluviicoccus keumensis]|uniref:DNA-binding FrmR family transcriptional regulator n=1 Tax=Fluviicoccus keumensis TaxID=1435465 RepID=A0A4Q7Z8R2_9GAMM|nr:metal-sensing transcriptional repressor [Fluviicoccus keumensis]RZU46858.1 DNA-binding FrmR family transcriptional regulator [Fluviicoccus keumensis]
MQTPLPEHKSELLKRLARVEGQIRGIQKLIQSDTECEQVLQQMTAARRALDKAFFEMLACVIESNVIEESCDKPVADRMSEVKALLTKYA